MKRPISSNLSPILSPGFDAFLRTADENEIRNAIDSCSCHIRKSVAIGWFVSRFDKKPFPYQPNLF